MRDNADTLRIKGKAGDKGGVRGETEGERDGETGWEGREEDGDGRE